MDGSQGNDRSFGRSAAMLLALAELAELAGQRCWAVRCLVFCILRMAEAAARAYAAGIVASSFAGQFVPPSCDTSADDTPDEAARLARSFRALAALFQTMAHRARLAARSPAQRLSARLSCFDRAADCPYAAPVKMHVVDTS